MAVCGKLFLGYPECVKEHILHFMTVTDITMEIVLVIL